MSTRSGIGMEHERLAPGYKRYILSDRETAFICQKLNLYCEGGDKRERHIVERITRILNRGRR